jgi:hypothetical protein
MDPAAALMSAIGELKIMLFEKGQRKSTIAEKNVIKLS